MWRRRQQFWVSSALCCFCSCARRCVRIRPVCHRHLRQRGPGGDGGSLALLPVCMQAQLHRHRVSLRPPVHRQRQHLHREPHRGGERPPVVPLQGRRAQHLLCCLSDGEEDNVVTDEGWCEHGLLHTCASQKSEILNCSSQLSANEAGG